MKIAILQSNYLPWTGEFELIDSVDKFVFYDNVQFTKQDWRTRNKIKTDNDNLWLSVPIQRQKLKTNIIDRKKIYFLYFSFIPFPHPKLNFQF